MLVMGSSNHPARQPSAHLGDADLAELALDAVAVGHQGLQPVNGVGQMELSARDERTGLKLARGEG